jgi:hypothetical protein
MAQNRMSIAAGGETREPANAMAESSPLSPAWIRFIAFCRSVKHGEVQSVKIQDGVPVLAEMVARKIRF